MFVGILLSISLASSIIVGSARSEPVAELDTSFSTRIQVERFDELGQPSYAKRILERYSGPEARAVVELEDVPATSGSDHHQVRVVYYYEAASGIWLRMASDLNECQESSKLEFTRELYGGDTQLPHELESRSFAFNHVIGVASLLFQIVGICSAQLTAQPTTNRMVRGMEAVKYGCQIGSDTQAEMLYASHEEALDDKSSLPMWLNLTLPGGTSFVLNFYSNLPVTKTPLEPPTTTSSFAFPLGQGCGSVLSERGGHGLAGGSQLSATMKSIRGLSFKARYLTTPRVGEPANGSSQEVESLYVAFNLRAGLLRRESLLLDHSMSPHQRAKSITIYDTRRGAKYNLVSTFSTKARDYNYSLSNIVDEGSKTTECVSMQMKPVADFRFIDFDRLQFMGRARVDGVGVKVYEEDDLDQLPFWLLPMVEVEGDGSDHAGSDMPLKQLTLVYHFVDEGRRDRLGQLLRIQVIIRDKLRRITLLDKQVDIFNFRWNRLEDSPTGVRAAHLFALGVNCAANTFEKSIWLDMYLESRSGLDSELFKDKFWAGNEILGEAIGAHFDLPRTHFDHVKSKVDRSQPENLYLEFRINYMNLKRATCRRLGRGQFMSQTRLMRSTSATFEDCLWFANYCSRLLDGAEVVFGHDETNSACLVDRLYKWRQLQLHEADLQSEATSQLKSLNYFQYEFGQYILHTINYSSAASPPPVGRPITQIKSLDHIGRQITLTTDQEQDVNFVISNIKISRVNKGIGAQQADTPGHLKHLGWRQLGADDNVVRKISSLRMVSYLQDPRTVGVLSETLCKSYCLTDIGCKSYSFCERSRSRPAECLVAKLDILEPELAQQLGSLLLTSGTWRENRVKQISTTTNEEGSQVASPEVAVVISKRCSIYSKSYADLFVRGSQMKLDLSKQTDVVAVENEDKCAERCFAKNLDYMRGIVRHKLELDKIHKDIMEMLDDNQMISESMVEKLDSAADWHHRHLKHLCLHFLYADQQNSSANNSCILSSPDKAKSSGGHTVDVIRPKIISKMTNINMHKMIFSNLYERMPGLRLTKSNETQTRGKLEDPILNHYANWLEFHKAGNNTQILLASDDVEHCARACTLQTHGPRPSCSSFDFVYETPPNLTARKYCLLNSQSLHDLGRKGLMARQVVYMSDFSNVQFWHFEPRELLLTSSARDGENDDGDDDGSDLYNLLSGMDVKISKSGNYRAFKSISLPITLLGVVSGLIIGMGVAKYWITHKAYMDEMTFKHRVIRTVHRLSGVSMTQMFQEREVRM